MALEPHEDGFDRDGCWSGCAVNVDDKIRLYYTGVNGKLTGIGTAVSTNHAGTEYEKSAKPIIERLSGGPYVQSCDPTVWQERDLGGQGLVWRMLVGSGFQAGGGTLLHFASDDGLRWRYQGRALAGYANTGSVWTAPILLAAHPHAIDSLSVTRISERHILSVTHEPGRTVYWTGIWNGSRFITKDEADAAELDLINHFLCPAVMADETDKDTWTAIGVIPESRSPSDQLAAGWAQTLSLPRLWRMTHQYALTQAPHPALKTLRTSAPREWRDLPISTDHVFELPSAGDTVEIDMEIELGSAEQVWLGVRKSPDGRELTTIRYDVSTHQITLDRSQSSLTNPSWPADRRRQSGTLKYPKLGTLRLHVYLDRSVLECFVNEEEAFASRIYPSLPGSVGLELAAAGGEARLVSLSLWPLSAAIAMPSAAK